jgi:hypothetical protein
MKPMAQHQDKVPCLILNNKDEDGNDVSETNGNNMLDVMRASAQLKASFLTPTVNCFPLTTFYDKENLSPFNAKEEDKFSFSQVRIEHEVPSSQVLTEYNAPFGLWSEHDNLPSQVLTQSDNDVDQDDPLDDAAPSTTTSPTPKILKITGAGGKCECQVGYLTPVWLTWEQVEDSKQLDVFLKGLTPADLRKAISERETSIKPASLDVAGYNETLDVEKILKMKQWGCKWMVRAWVTKKDLALQDVKDIEVTDEVAKFCEDISSWWHHFNKCS